MRIGALLIGLVVLAVAGMAIYMGAAQAPERAAKGSVPQPSDTILSKEWTPEQLGTIFQYRGQAFDNEAAGIRGSWTPGEPGWDIGVEHVGRGWVKAVYAGGGMLNSGWTLMVYLPDTDNIKVGDHIRVQGRIFDVSTTFVAGVPLNIVELKPGQRLDEPN